MDGTLSNEVRFRAKVKDHVPPHELLVWAGEIEKLEAKVRILGGTVKLCSDDLAKMRESMEEWREVAKLSPVDNRRRYD